MSKRKQSNKLTSKIVCDFLLKENYFFAACSSQELLRKTTCRKKKLLARNAKAGQQVKVNSTTVSMRARKEQQHIDTSIPYGCL
jgi:hypothetical protein